MTALLCFLAYLTIGSAIVLWTLYEHDRDAFAASVAFAICVLGWPIITFFRIKKN